MIEKQNEITSGDVNQAHLVQLDLLPNNWKHSSVKEIASVVSINNKKLAKKKYLSKGTFPVIDQGQEPVAGFYNDNSLLINQDPPFIVFGDHTRAFKFVAQNFIPGADGVKVLKINEADSKWAFYVFQAIKLPNKGYARHFQYLKQAYIPLPPPAQQKQIVAKIEKLFSHIDAGIESLKTAKQKLKQYRQSVLKAAVTGELTKDWRAQNANKIEPANQLLKRIQTERRQRWEQQKLNEFQAKGKPPKNDKWKEKYKEPEVLENIGLKIPETWETISFEQLGQWSGGGTPSKSKPEFWSGGEILWITPKDMKSDFLEDSIDKITSVAVKKSTVKLITEDSLLFVVRSGILRRILPVGLTRKKATVNQDIKALTFSVSDVAEYFLICSKALEEQIRRKCMKGGTTVESVEVPRLLNFVLPLPSLKEQKEIVQRVEEKLTAADRLMAELDTKLTQAQQQKQTTLASAFKGDLI